MSNPTLLMLPLDGTLAGEDQSGPVTATGPGALRYVPSGRKNWGINTRAAVNTTGWSGVTRVQDDAFITEDNPEGWCFEATSSATNVGAIRSAIRWPYGTGCTIGIDVKWVSGDQSGWYVWGSQSGVGNTGGLYSLTPADLDGVIHRKVITHANADNFAAMELQISRGPGGGIVTPSTIHFGNITVEEGTTAGTWIPENYWLEHWGMMGVAHASPSAEAVLAYVPRNTTNLLPYGSMRSGANSATPTGWTMQSGTANNRDWGGVRYFELAVTVASSPSPLLYGGSVASYGAVVAGTTYTIQMWVYNPNATARSVQLGVFWYDSAPATLTSDSGVQSIPAGTAMVVKHTAVAPVNAVWARPQINFAGAAVGEKFIVKEAMLEASSYANPPVPQFDGAGTLMAGHTYSGTAHASTSTRAGTDITVASAGHIETESGVILFDFIPDQGVGGTDNIFLVGNTSQDAMQLRRNTAGQWTFGNRNVTGWSETNWAEALSGIVTCRIEWWDSGATVRIQLNGGSWRTVAGKVMTNLATDYIVFGRNVNAAFGNALVFSRLLTEHEQYQFDNYLDINGFSINSFDKWEAMDMAIHRVLRGAVGVAGLAGTGITGPEKASMLARLTALEAEELGDHNDTTFTGLVTGQVPTWDGTKWVNSSVVQGLAEIQNAGIAVSTAPVATINFDGADWSVTELSAGTIQVMPTFGTGSDDFAEGNHEHNPTLNAPVRANSLADISSNPGGVDGTTLASNTYTLVNGVVYDITVILVVEGYGSSGVAAVAQLRSKINGVGLNNGQNLVFEGNVDGPKIHVQTAAVTGTGAAITISGHLVWVSSTIKVMQATIIPILLPRR